MVDCGCLCYRADRCVKRSLSPRISLPDYISDGEEPLQEEFIRSLRERFPNDKRPPDGLIYERIRYYEGYLDGPVNRIAANHWWAALERVPGSKKGKYLRAFLKHPTLPQAFDELLPIAGIWEGMRIGLLHKLVSMRCDEVRY